MNPNEYVTNPQTQGIERLEGIRRRKQFQKATPIRMITLCIEQKMFVYAIATTLCAFRFVCRLYLILFLSLVCFGHFSRFFDGAT